MKQRESGHKRWKLANYSLFVEALILLLFTYSQVEAARPLTTDDAGTVEERSFELEISYDLSGDEDHSRNQSLGISLKYGLIQRLDLGICFPYEIKPKEEFGDPQVGIKYLLLKEKGDLPALSLTFGCELGSPDCAFTGIASKEIHDLVFHINLCYAASGLKGEDGVTIYAGAIEYVFSKSFTLVAELVGEADTEEKASEALIGVNLPVSEKVVIDFGIGRGFNTVSAKEGKATIGMTCEF